MPKSPGFLWIVALKLGFVIVRCSRRNRYFFLGGILLNGLIFFGGNCFPDSPTWPILMSGCALAQGQLSLDTTTAFITLAAQRKAAQLEAGPSNGVGLFNLPFSTTYDELQQHCSLSLLCFSPSIFHPRFFFKLWSKFVTFLYFFTYLFVIGIDEFLFLEILSCWLKRIGKMGKYWGKAGNREEEGSIVCTHISVIRSFFVVCVQVPGTTYKFQLIKSKIPKFIAYHPHPCEKSAHMWILFFSALTAETVVWHQCMLKDYEGLQTIKMVHKEQAFSITKGTKTLTEPFVETVFFAHHCYWLCWWAQRSGNSYLQS